MHDTHISITHERRVARALVYEGSDAHLAIVSIRAIRVFRAWPAIVADSVINTLAVSTVNLRSYLFAAKAVAVDGHLAIVGCRGACGDSLPE
jgi:hypothetical protein